MEKVKVTVIGESKQIDLLIRENRVKISRGLLRIEKASPGKTPKKTDLAATPKKVYEE
jgi:hypothetical protein